MRIAVPREIKNNEFRVAITPAGVHDLVSNGHEVLIETGAGLGSSISDEAYVAAGATIAPDATMSKPLRACRRGGFAVPFNGRLLTDDPLGPQRDDLQS